MALASVWLGLSACELSSNFEGLGDQLLDPELRGIDAPGRRWIAGPHYDLNVLQDDQTGRSVVAAREDASQLVLIDFEAERFCRVGVASQYFDAIAAPSRPALVPFLISPTDVDGNTAGLTLAFATFDCQRSPFSVPVNGAPVGVFELRESTSGAGLLVKTPDDGLAVVDPWEQTSTPLAKSVRPEDPLSVFGHTLWVDSGVITLGNEELATVASFGTNVTALAASRQNSQLAYIESGTDDSGGVLYTVDALAATPPRLVAASACDPFFLMSSGRQWLGYFSPCAKRQLVLSDVLNESSRIIDSNVAGRPVAQNLSGRSVLTYITTPTRDAARGTLWILDNDDRKLVVTDDAVVAWRSAVVREHLLTAVGGEGIGYRLIAWKPDSLTIVAEHVAEVGPLGQLDNGDLTLLGNFDGETGELLRLRSGNFATELLARGVPTQPGVGDAFLSNFSGDSGDLTLLDREDGSTEVIARGVARRAFVVAQQFGAVLMLAERDVITSTNQLRLHMLRSKRDYALHDGVTEAREVAFPEPGVLYNVVVGDESGVWFAKAW